MFRKRPPQLSVLEDLTNTYNDVSNTTIKNLSLEENFELLAALNGWKSLHTSLLYKIDAFEKNSVKLSLDEFNLLQELKLIRDQNVKHLIRVQLRLDELNRASKPRERERAKDTSSPSSSFNNYNLRSTVRDSPSTSSSARPMMKSLRHNSNSTSVQKVKTSLLASQAANAIWKKPKETTPKEEQLDIFADFDGSLQRQQDPKTYDYRFGSDSRSSDRYATDSRGGNDSRDDSKYGNLYTSDQRISTPKYLASDKKPYLYSERDDRSPYNQPKRSSYDHDDLMNFNNWDKIDNSYNSNLIDLENDLNELTIKPVRLNDVERGQDLKERFEARDRREREKNDLYGLRDNSQGKSYLDPRALYPDISIRSNSESRASATPLRALNPDIARDRPPVPSAPPAPPAPPAPKKYVYTQPKPMNISLMMQKQKSKNGTSNSAKSSPHPKVSQQLSSSPSYSQNTPKPKPKPKSSQQKPNIQYNYVKPSIAPKAKANAKSATKKEETDSPTMDLLDGYDDTDDINLDDPHGYLTKDSEQNKLIKSIRGIDPVASKSILNDIVVHGDEVYWDDIVGLESAKNSLKEAVVYPFLRPDLFKGLREPTRGMLLFGPPGTGKTMLARAVATESKSTFFSINPSSLTSKYLGESEKLVKALFLLAKKLSPSIVFIDEIDSLLSARAEGENDSTRRIKNEFLVQWSELSSAAAGRESGNDDIDDVSRVLILGATNLPWSIDEAARRRFVRRQYIPLPEDDTRISQIKKLLKFQKNTLSDDDYKELIDLTSGFSGSDITALAKDSAMGPLRSLGDKLLLTPTDQIRPINIDDFKSSLSYIRPSVSKEGLKQYEEWSKQFGSSGA